MVFDSVWFIIDPNFEKVDTLIKAAAATVEEIVHVAMPE